MFIPDALLRELSLVGALIDLLKDILKPPIILLQDCILGAHIQWQRLRQRHLEARVCESRNRLISIVLGLRDPAPRFEVEHFDFLWSTALGGKDHGELSIAFDDEIFGTVLITKGMAANYDGFLPAGDEAGNSRDDDGFAENGASQSVADSAIGG